MARQYIGPSGAFINETGSRQFIGPSGSFIGETSGGASTSQVSSDLAGSYGVRAPVSSDRSGSYAVLTVGQVSSDLAGTYKVRAPVSSDQAGAYTLRTPVSSDRSGSYAVFSTSASITTETWENNAGIAYTTETVNYSWYPGGRFGSLNGITPVEGSKALVAGVLTVTGLVAGPGLLLGAVRGASVSVDKVFVQPMTAA